MKTAVSTSLPMKSSRILQFLPLVVRIFLRVVTTVLSSTANVKDCWRFSSLSFSIKQRNTGYCSTEKFAMLRGIFFLHRWSSALMASMFLLATALNLLLLIFLVITKVKAILSSPRTFMSFFNNMSFVTLSRKIYRFIA